MQVPAGQPLAGMVHHKIHDANWTGLPLLPHLDPQLRELHPVSTAATLNLAATAAQAARLYEPLRPRLRRRGRWPRPAPRTPRRKANPAGYAPESDGIGGGAYNDNKVDDEFYWAAAELYLTTGEKQYRDDVLASPVHTADVFGAGRLRLGRHGRRRPGSTWPWCRTGCPAGPGARVGRRRRRASTWRSRRGHPYGVPYAPASNIYDWGSNSQVLNNLVVRRVGVRHHRPATVPRRRARGHGLPLRPQRAQHLLRHRLRRGAARRTSTAAGTPTSSTRPCRTRRAGTLAGGPNSSHPGPVRAEQADRLRRPVLLHRRHPVLVDQRTDDQLERAAGLDRLLRGGPGVTGPHSRGGLALFRGPALCFFIRASF